jgi:hypothetical protein
MTDELGGTRALAVALREHGGIVAASLVPDRAADGREPGPPAPPGAPQLAASGPRAAGHEADYELLLEMILEGSQLHYGGPRVVSDEDPDLALLLGDQLYALGLSRLADLGDLAAVAELADLISLLATARAAGDGELADAVWRAAAAAIGWGSGSSWGSGEDHTAAKELARRGDPRARRALERAAAGS